MPLQGVGDAQDVVDHGRPVGARVEERGAVRAAEVHRWEQVAERAGQLRRPLLLRRRRVHLGGGERGDGGVAVAGGRREAAAVGGGGLHSGGKEWVCRKHAAQKS